MPLPPLPRRWPLALVALFAAASSATAAAPPLRDPLPEGAVARLGHARLVCPGEWNSSVSLSPDGRFALRHGRCYDLVSGKMVRPFAVPAHYRLDRLFTGGGYAAAGEDYLVFTPEARRICFSPRTSSRPTWPSAPTARGGR